MKIKPLISFGVHTLSRITLSMPSIGCNRPNKLANSRGNPNDTQKVLAGSDKSRCAKFFSDLCLIAHLGFCRSSYGYIRRISSEFHYVRSLRAILCVFVFFFY